MQRRLAITVWTSLIAAAALLLVLAILCYGAIHRSIVASRWVIHTHYILENLEALQDAVDKIELSNQAYLLKNDPSLLSSLQALGAQLAALVETIKGLTADNQRQQRNSTELQDLLRRRVAALQAYMSAPRPHDSESSKSESSKSDSGAALTRKINPLLADMTAEEHRLLHAREGAEARAAKKAYRVIIYGFALTLICLFLIGAVTSTMMVQITRQNEVAAGLARERDAARASEHLKAEFLANMSHEIRTPMNAVIGMTHLLLDTELTAQQREFAATVAASAETLLSLLNDILDFSKINAGKLSIEKVSFDLRATIESVEEMLAAPAQAKGLELAAFIDERIPERLIGDPARLRQVLVNLIGNAIKFTTAGEVVVHLSPLALSPTAATIQFRVKDSGIGISKEVQERLFQPFAQADSSTMRKYGGTGLGLAISAQLVAAMGGKLEVESELGKGACFRFDARFGRDPLQDRAAKAPRYDLAGARVLVVDDNATNRQILVHQLAARAVAAQEAESGEAALAELRRAALGGQPYQIALLDMQMPGLDGAALARAIKADPAIAGTRILLMSSVGQLLDEAQLHSLGIEFCLSKPVKQAQVFYHMSLLVGGTGDQPAQAAPVAPLAPRQGAVPGVRILIAEDNAVNRRLALHQVEKLGYKAEAVANGLEVIDVLSRVSYGIILMDCQMPEMDGYQASREIRRRETGSRHTVIIALTANALAEEREKCLAAGMDDYLSKPVVFAELARMIDKWARTISAA